MRELTAEKIRGLDPAEIEAKIKERNDELFHLRFRNQVRQLTNPVLIRERRRDIARLKTVLAEMLAGKTAVPAPVATPTKPAKAAKAAKKEKKA